MRATQPSAVTSARGEVGGQGGADVCEKGSCVVGGRGRYKGGIEFRAEG